MLSVVVVHVQDFPQQCVDALLKNTVGELEVIVVLSMYEGKVPDFPVNVRVLTYPDRVPVSKACNIGIKEAKGEYISLHCGDTVTLPNWNVYPILTLRKYKDVGYVSGLQTLSGLPPTVPGGVCQHVVRIGGAIFETIVLRDTLKGLDEAFADGYGYDDTDLHARVIEHGFNPILVNFITLTDATDVKTNSHALVFGEKRVEADARNGRLLIEKHRGHLPQTCYVPYYVVPVIVNGKMVNPNSPEVPVYYGGMLSLGLGHGPYEV